MWDNKVFLIFFVIIISLNFSFCQEYGYGVGIDFSSWSIETSSVTIKISKNEFLENIVDYFYSKNFFDNFEEEEIDELKKIFYKDIEKLSKMGFGNREIIRLVLISKKVPLTTKTLIPIGELCIKKCSIKKVAEKFGLNYEIDIWLESNNIYKKIVSGE
jgi:hypothetical protein